jgi:hypothetical protein
MELFIAATEALRGSGEADTSEASELSDFSSLVNQLSLEVALHNPTPGDDLRPVDLLRNTLAPYFAVNYSVENVDTTGDFTLGLVGAFKAWTYLHALLKHYNTFMVSGRGTIDDVLNCDVYDPQYWKRASEVPENNRKGMAGVGDHWIYAGDPSIRWFGNNPPTGPGDFETGIAGALARSYGGVSFIDAKYFTTDDAGQLVLTNEFKTKLRNIATDFFVVAPFDGTYASVRKYFSVDFDNTNPPNYIAKINVGTYDPGDYWRITSSVDVYDNLLRSAITSIRGSGGEIELTGDDCTFWEDQMSLYLSQIRSQSTSRLTNMQTALQASQQSVSMGTNLSKSVSRTRQEVTGNIR